MHNQIGGIGGDCVVTYMRMVTQCSQPFQAQAGDDDKRPVVCYPGVRVLVHLCDDFVVAGSVDVAMWCW